MEIINVGFSEFLEENVKEVTVKMKWMENRTFKLAENIEEVKDFIDKAISVGRCAVDLETTGLNSRTKEYVEPLTQTVTHAPIEKIVGIGLCYDSKFALYIPLNHKVDTEFNLPEKDIYEEIKRLCSNCITVYHHAKFDLAFLKNHGIIIDDYTKIDDTLILSRLYDAGNKNIKLKHLSDVLINQPMIEFSEITGNKNRFDLISPKIGYIYGASDPMCTLDLYNFFIAQDIIKNQSLVYSLEKRVVFVVMEMESNYIKINVPYLKDLKIKTESRIKEIVQEVHTLAGREFNIGSTQQLGKLLFDELKYTYPDKERTKSGQYSTSSETLEKIAHLYPIVKKIVEYRGLEKCLGTYINNLLANYDENECVKLGFNQNGTDTGRFSSPGGEGIDKDGYAGVNVQSIPKEVDEDNSYLDLRKAFIPRPGMTIVAADYENEEMRVATNLSGETVWMDAIKEGIDFHTATAATITGKQAKDITKPERKIAKCCNFLALYLGGPYTLAGQAKISVNEAKKILANFFAGVKKLKKWMDTEIIKARKIKYVKTAFGRTRSLSHFYDSGDRKIESHGDRCVVNTQIQGVCADIMKAVMAKMYNWIHRNNLQNDIRMLLTMHDELVFEINTEKLHTYIPEIVKIMMLSEVITNQLKWPIPLTVDVKYGDSWRAPKSFFKDNPELKENINSPVFETNINNIIKASEEENKIVEEKKTISEDLIKELKTELIDTELKAEPTEDKFLIYTIKDRKKITLRWLNDILLFLTEDNKKISSNQKKILKIKDSEGNSLLVSDIEVPVEGFLTLVKFFGI